MTLTVLLTGANGFIGSHTTLLFESLGYQVVAVDIMSRSDDLALLPINVSTSILDVTDAKAFRKLCEKEKVTHIIHLAHPPRKEDPNVLDFCLQAMLNIVGTAKEMSMRRVIFASSGAVYGQLPKGDGSLIRENNSVAIYPTFLYRSAKILGEWLGDFYAQHYGVDFIALRLSSVYGPGQVMGIGAAVKHGILGRECRPYLTRVPDDLIFVKDAARAVHLACLSERPGSHVYNIASTKPYLEEDLEGAMRRQLSEVSFQISKHPHAETTAQYRQRDILDVTLARDELGFIPEFDLDSGIAAIAEWVRSEKGRLS